jgi:hypothetical protein
MADKTDIWQEWSEKAVRYAMGERKSKSTRVDKNNKNLRQEWFGQFPALIEYYWRKWFKK